MVENKEILAVICPHCYDMWFLSKSEIGYAYKNIELNSLTGESYFPNYLINNTDCHRCGKMYLPLSNLKRMDEFVFEATKTVKM